MRRRAFLGSLILLTGCAGSQRGTAEDVRIVDDDLAQRNGEWVVSGAVRNRGNRAVRSLTVDVTFLDGSEVVGTGVARMTSRLPGGESWPFEVVLSDADRVNGYRLQLIDVEFA